VGLGSIKVSLTVKYKRWGEEGLNLTDEGKDAIQLAQQGGEGLTAVAVVEVKPQQHFGIGVPPPGLGLEAVELAPKLLEVVDFAVKDQHHPTIVAGHGLVAQGGEVEDGQAGVAQAHFCLVVEVETGVVRATVGEEGCGLVEVIRGCFNILEKTGNTAHKIRKYIMILMINISVAGQANIHQEKGLALTG
jgi:hypothetical protein